MSPSKDYYRVLSVGKGATQGDIKTAYKRRALETHPDRFPEGSPESRTAVRDFQNVNEAYYTLGDETRRREYDGISRSFHPQQSEYDAQFGDAFEEMLHENGMDSPSDIKLDDLKASGKTWGLAGGLSGAVLGFIIANIPGALAGGLAGNRLGAIRDSRGQSVMEVFQSLPQAQRASILTELAAKVFAQVGGGAFSK